MDVRYRIRVASIKRTFFESMHITCNILILTKLRNYQLANVQGVHKELRIDKNFVTA